MARFLLALLCAGVVAGCGSGNTTGTGNNGSGATPVGGGGSGGTLVVTGSLSLSIGETSSSSNKCQTAGGLVSAILTFDAYDLQFSIPTGTTHFPTTPSPGAVAFFNGNDSTQEWSIGTNQSATASGTVTLSSDGKSGSVDVDMLPDPPRPNPALKPIHVKGTFTCG